MSSWKEFIATGEPYGTGNKLRHFRITDEEIVRCRDCKNFYYDMVLSPRSNGLTTQTSAESCKRTGHFAEKDGFCAWGVRRNEETTA